MGSKGEKKRWVEAHIWLFLLAHLTKLPCCLGFPCCFEVLNGQIPLMLSAAFPSSMFWLFYPIEYGSYGRGGDIPSAREGDFHTLVNNVSFHSPTCRISQHPIRTFIGDKMHYYGQNNVMIK